MYALRNVVSSAWAGIAARATRPSASDAHVKALFIFTSRFLRWSPFDVPARTTSTPAGVDVVRPIVPGAAQWDAEALVPRHEARPPPWRAPHRSPIEGLKRGKVARVDPGTATKSRKGSSYRSRFTTTKPAGVWMIPLTWPGESRDAAARASASMDST